ncbi:MAG TPA: TonB-dependent receptor [Opitutaceae bacterium]|nr:TonB-dependent receptor [Opitutaceae bacterium]
MNKLPERKFPAWPSLVAAAGLMAVTGFAQTTAPTETGTQNPQVLDKYVVTGSYIPAAADEAKALPVQTISVQAIETSGVRTNVLDVLRKTVPQIQGGNNVGIENGNISGAYTNGGSQVSLRNTDTLVLINGRRVAPSAVAASGAAGTGAQFVDLNLIPISAVERIEVLTDGASAIYGTDAVSGVINIILRQDYTGAEVGFHMSMAPKDTGGYWRERSVSAVAGGGDGKTHLMFSAEWSKSQPLWERDVAYDNPYFGTPSYPGVINDNLGTFYVLKAGLNAPPAGPNSVATLVAQGVYAEPEDVTTGFNLALKPTIMNSVDKRVATLSGSHKITDTLELKGDFMYAFTETNYQLNPQPVSASSSTLISYGQSPITDTNFTIRNRFIYGPNRIYDNQTNFYRATAELDGKVNEFFNWQVYANYNVSYQTAYGFNQILNSALLNGIRTGLINMFAIQQDPVKLAQANIFGTSVGNYTSQLYTYDALANGKVFELPAGPVQYAAGLEYRKESLDASADYNSTIPAGASTSLWNNGTSLSPFKNQRDVKSAFAELKVPLFSPQNGVPGLHILSLDGAIRHESYSDGNKTSVPKISVRYLPFNDELALRATYAKSFSAPTLYSLYGPSSSGFTNSPSGLTAYNAQGQAIGKFPNIQGYQLNGFNPHLTPAKAKSWTAGVVYSPRYAKGLEITVDYYKIDQTDLIGSPGGTLTMMQSVEQYGAASPFSRYVALGNFPGQGGTAVTAPGQLSPNPVNVYVLQTLVNIATQTQHGFDINFKYTLPWEQYGRFVVSSEWALLKQFFLKTGPDDSGTEYAGNNGYGTLPKTRSYTTLDWDYRSYGATVGLTRINSVDSFYGSKVSPYTTLDLQFRMNLGKLNSVFRGVSFDVGCNNVNNQSPPLDRDSFASPPFDGSIYSFFGRMFYADLHIKF